MPTNEESALSIAQRRDQLLGLPPGSSEKPELIGTDTLDKWVELYGPGGICEKFMNAEKQIYLFYDDALKQPTDQEFNQEPRWLAGRKFVDMVKDAKIAEAKSKGKEIFLEILNRDIANDHAQQSELVHGIRKTGAEEVKFFKAAIPEASNITVYESGISIKMEVSADVAKAMAACNGEGLLELNKKLKGDFTSTYTEPENPQPGDTGIKYYLRVVVSVKNPIDISNAEEIKKLVSQTVHDYKLAPRENSAPFKSLNSVDAEKIRDRYLLDGQWPNPDGGLSKIYNKGSDGKRPIPMLRDEIETKARSAISPEQAAPATALTSGIASAGVNKSIKEIADQFIKAIEGGGSHALAKEKGGNTPTMT